MLVHPQFDPVAVSLGPYTVGGVTLGPFAIRWYGIMYLIGFVLFVVLGRWRARRNMLTGWRASDVDDMLFYGVFGVILGGRLGYVLFYKPEHFLAHPLEDHKAAAASTVEVRPRRVGGRSLDDAGDERSLGEREV